MKIIFATKNSGKIKEVKDLLAGLPIEIIGQAEAGIGEEIEEDGKTFSDNARKKASYVAEKTGLPAISDDSGICIVALDGRPGIFSARWAGEGADEAAIIEFTLSQARDIPEFRRQAYFECAACLAAPDGRHWLFVGRTDGRLATEPRGTMRAKLPYDVIFIPEGHDRTFGEMTDREKNSLSHRGRAFAKLRTFIIDNLDELSDELTRKEA